MDDTRERVAVAERAARAGGVVARGLFRQPVDVATKGDKTDLVTEADRDAQQQVIATVQQAFPKDAFVCEEEVSLVGEGVDDREGVPETGPAWVVDPIDGTANFVRGLRFWCTSVAAVRDGEAVGVASYLPVAEDVYAAGPESVTHNGEPMSVSEETDPEAFTVGVTGLTPASAEGAAVLTATAERFGDVRRLGSMQGTLALVAAGRLDATVVPERAHPWDSIAGAYLVERAGGTVTDPEGEPWHHDSPGLVVSNGRAHDEVLAAVRTDR
jgi:myo-inositol-1(or 4)-monophosphatase